MMIIQNYDPPNMNAWTGRVDSTDDFDSFRIHQWIKPLNIEKPIEKSQYSGIGILGFKSDLGIELNLGRPGAFKGPDVIRKELANKPCNFSRDLYLYDCGDIVVKDITLERGQVCLSQAVERILSLNLFPILLGGGHEIVFGHYLGIFNYLKKEDGLGIINFDAHFDNRPLSKEMGNSGTMFRQISDLNRANKTDFSYLVLGIQKNSNTLSLFKEADESQTEYILAKEMNINDLFPIFEKIDEFSNDLDHIYVTLDCDVFNSSVAPGVSAPQPLGLNPEIVLQILKYIVRSKKVISFDIAEVSPRFDHDNITASLAATIILTLISKLDNLR